MCHQHLYKRVGRELIYYSDGCAGQYKNRYNFINLLYHETDFGIKAQWNFLPHLMGKVPVMESVGV